MPQVPRVMGPSAEAAPLPGARYVASSAAGAGAMQQSARLNDIAQATQQWAREYQNNVDLTATWSAETALRDDYLQFEQGELAKQGVNAQGATQRASQWWAENGKKYAEGLTDRQQSAYVRNISALRQSTTGALFRHERTQTEGAMVASANARVGSAINAAITDPTPERVTNSKREIVEATGIAARLAGLPPDAQAALVGEKVNLLHRGVVLQLADTDPDGAKAYFYGNKKEIAGGTQLELEKVVERSGKLQKAQAAADDIMAKGMSLADAEAHIETTYSGEDEAAIKAEVHNRWTTKKQGEAEIVGKAYGSAQLAVSQGRRVAANDWSAMDDAHRAAIVERQRAEQKRNAAEAEGRAVKTDFGTWDTLNRWVTSDPKAFAAADLGRWSDKVSRSDLMQFGDLQRKIRTGDEKPVKDAVSLGQQVDIVSDNLKLKANSPDSAALRKSIYDAVQLEQQTKGKDLTYEERQKVIDRQVMTMTVPGMVWDSDKPSYQLTAEERATARAKVPSADRALIVEALRKHGKPVTEEAISDLYLKKQSR